MERLLCLEFVGRGSEVEEWWEEAEERPENCRSSRWNRSRNRSRIRSRGTIRSRTKGVGVTWLLDKVVKGLEEEEVARGEEGR